jgi:hypothetical protein
MTDTRDPASAPALRWSDASDQECADNQAVQPTSPSLIHVFVAVGEAALRWKERTAGSSHQRRPLSFPANSSPALPDSRAIAIADSLRNDGMPLAYVLLCLYH